LRKRLREMILAEKAA